MFRPGLSQTIWNKLSGVIIEMIREGTGRARELLVDERLVGREEQEGICSCI